MKRPQKNPDLEQVSCDECRKVIPKGTALTIEGWEVVLHFCGTGCLKDWKRKKGNK
jgi:hypothetical protein